tara:strand:+ start:2456 stop:3280 length:825 start_codon:yes stop_codon:yes gene_type:complete
MILVTGHKGYIGSHLYKKVKMLGKPVVGIDLKDGEDLNERLPDGDFDFVFHFAALPRVEMSVESPSYTLKQNVLSTSRLLEWSKDHGVKRFIFSSSSAIMGHGDGVPLSPYGLHKRMSEMECELYSRIYDLDTVCLRYFNAYSEDQPYGGAYTTAIAAWMEKIRSCDQLRMDGDGEQTRDLVHVEDIVSANIFVMNSEQKFNGKYFNVGSGEAVSMNYIKNYIDEYNKGVSWKYALARKGDARNTLADISELKALGWEPKVSIEEGLKRCFNAS